MIIGKSINFEDLIRRLQVEIAKLPVDPGEYLLRPLVLLLLGIHDILLLSLDSLLLVILIIHIFLIFTLLLLLILLFLLFLDYCRHREEVRLHLTAFGYGKVFDVVAELVPGEVLVVLAKLDRDEIDEQLDRREVHVDLPEEGLA